MKFARLTVGGPCDAFQKCWIISLYCPLSISRNHQLRNEQRWSAQDQVQVECVSPAPTPHAITLPTYYLCAQLTSPSRLLKTAFHFLAGLGSGTLSAVLLQPIDLLKTRVQQSGHHSLRLALREIRDSAAAASSSRFGSSASVLPALWRGATPSALRTGFGSAIYFTSLNAIRTHVSRVPFFSAAAAAPTPDASNNSSRAAGAGAGTTAASSSAAVAATVKAQQQQHSSSLVKLSNTGNLLAGAVARTFAGMLLMPLTVIKVRYESSLYAYPSIAAAARGIFAKEGVRGFVSGFGATAMRDAPYAGLYVLFYEQSKKRLSAWHVGGGEGGSDSMGGSTSAGINFSSGVIAGAACSMMSNPFDAVKTRIQLQPGLYRNTFHAAHRMVMQEGLRSLLDGLALRMGRKAMSSALAWTVYEELLRRAEITLNPAKRTESML